MIKYHYFSKFFKSRCKTYIFQKFNDGGNAGFHNRLLALHQHDSLGGVRTLLREHLDVATSLLQRGEEQREQNVIIILRICWQIFTG